MRADGSDVRLVAPRRGGCSYTPAWSPDGRRLAFSSSAETPNNAEIYTVRLDGSGLRRLAGLPHRDDWATTWSHDGTRIAFHSLDAVGRAQLYAVRPNGRGLTRLGVAGQDAAWLPPR